jgi:hypothetical protein
MQNDVRPGDVEPVQLPQQAGVPGRQRPAA